MVATKIPVLHYGIINPTQLVYLLATENGFELVTITLASVKHKTAPSLELLLLLIWLAK